MTAKLEAMIQSNQERMEAHHTRTMVKMDSRLENLEASPEEIESEAEREEVPKGEAAVETFGALKERYGDWHIAAEHP
jgi:hypothetical protein